MPPKRVAPKEGEEDLRASFEALLHGDSVKVRPKRVAKPKPVPPPLPTGVPAWLATPDEVSGQIRARLGLSAMTYHPVPRVNVATGAAEMLDEQEVQARRDAVWRSALDEERGEGIIIVSMDPGTRNFALRVERRWRSGRCETLYFNVLDLDPEADARRRDESIPAAKRRKTGKSDAQGVLRTHSILHAAFFSDPLRSWLQGAHVVLMEKQEFDNNLATRTSMHALGLVLALLSLQVEPTYAIVAETSTKLKNQVIAVPRDLAERVCPGACPAGAESVVAPCVKDLTRHFLKKCGTETAQRFLSAHGDGDGLRCITAVPRSRRKKGVPSEEMVEGVSAKKDDLADTVCHIEAWRAYVGWRDGA